jgi:glycine/D-amino acid oxidase-like deaminating enzyme/nitrite reductase/ring-hydroxylating ferredoxin subunit
MDHVAKHLSLWLDTASLQEFPVLDRDLDVDVCIVGGGITGLTAARLLKRAGKTVAIVEALRCGGGETGHTTAHVSVHHDLYYSDTIDRFGEDDARLILGSRRAAIAQMESFIVDDGIQCHWERVPAYLFSEEASGVRDIQAELEACVRLGIDAEWTTDMPVRFPVLGAMRIANQAQLHPLEYLRALASMVPGNGSYVFEHTRAVDVHADRVDTEHGTIRCKDVVVATNGPIVGQFLVTKIAAYRTYAMAFRVVGAAAPDALLWDTQDPYHYVRVHRRGGVSFLVVGGEDHKTGQGETVDPDAAWHRLEAWARGRFTLGEVAAQWSGQILEPADGLPFIGRFRDHVYVATGYSGDGITNGTLAGMLLSEEVLGQHSPIAKVYDPTRVASLASREYVKENVDYPVHMLTDRLKKTEGDKLRVVQPGEGKILRVGGEKLAVYRENDGTVHAFSPVCPHMGCHVAFNAAESSWDCPCHGSRFDATNGEVLNGPATKGLAAADVSDRASAVPQRPSQPERPSQL